MKLDDPLTYLCLLDYFILFQVGTTLKEVSVSNTCAFVLPSSTPPRPTQLTAPAKRIGCGHHIALSEPISLGSFVLKTHTRSMGMVDMQTS
jgi:hypothetical protein